MKILIITHYYPPLNTIGALRPYSWAKYWSLCGHDVYVLTTKKYPFDGNLDLTRNNHINAKVIEVPYSGILANTILSKNKITRSFSSNIKNNKSNYIIELAIKFRRKYLANYLDLRHYWINGAVEEGKKLIKQKNIDVMVSTFPPYSVHVVASKLKGTFPSLQWIADYRDLWTGNPRLGGKGVVALLQEKKEKRYLKNVDNVVTVSQDLADYLNILLNKKTHVITNGFDSEDFLSLDNYYSFDNKSVRRIVYTGSLRAKNQDPGVFFSALEQLISEEQVLTKKINVLLYGDIYDFDVSNYKCLNASGIIKFMGRVSRKKSLEIQRDSDALLFVNWENSYKLSNGIITGKIFEYISSGTEVISVGSDNRQIIKMLKMSGAGQHYGKDVARIKGVIKRILTQNSKMKLNNEYLYQFDRKYLASEYLKIINELDEK